MRRIDTVSDVLAVDQRTIGVIGHAVHPHLQVARVRHADARRELSKSDGIAQAGAAFGER